MHIVKKVYLTMNCIVSILANAVLVIIGGSVKRCYNKKTVSNKTTAYFYLCHISVFKAIKLIRLNETFLY